jgi:hypothetical protein
MKTFTIENDSNNITIHATIQEAEAVANAERFRTEAQLGKLANRLAGGPADRNLEQPARGDSGAQVQGPGDGGQPDLEGDSEPGQRVPG